MPQEESIPDPPPPSNYGLVPEHSSAPHQAPSATTANLSATALAIAAANAAANGTGPHIPENLMQLNNEYVRRRYRRKYENPEKSKELLLEQQHIVDNLKTAIEGKMDVAAIGVLQQIITALDGGILYPPVTITGPNGHIDSSVSKNAQIDPGDRQRALCKANIGPTISLLMRELGGHFAVCEKTLHCIAYLCRYSDENKTSVCLENCKSLGLSGVCELIVGAIKRHKGDKKILEVACDAIRCLCALESNRDRFGHAGACEALAFALPNNQQDSEVTAWLCRAIGHLANHNARNCDLLANAGACENIIVALQKFPHLMNVCTEACYSIRNLAALDAARERFLNDFGAESILAVYKQHLAQEAFAIESCHALCNLIGSEDDDLIPRIASSGFINLSIKALKKNPFSEFLPRWIFNIFYYIACCDEKLSSKLVTGEVLDALSISLENHASNESMAEWACRFVHQLAPLEGASNKLRNSGMCEMITSAVQRQAISKVVSSVGCLAIGDLAIDTNNQSRLSSSGACEAVVGALKRHCAIPDVVYNSCYGIHYLCTTQNNVSWMGAYGACEAVTIAINKHIKDPEVAKYTAMALGSLAYKDEGNQVRIHTSGGNQAIVDLLGLHAKTADIVENCCRAIYNLCEDGNNVSELGKNGACGLVVQALQTHANSPTVITQTLLAIAGLAVKLKNDKVHKGNTRKLVEQGAIENIVAVMQKFADQESVQRAAGMAITSLARLEANRLKLGQVGACELVCHAIQLHINSAQVVSKLSLAIDALAMDSDPNKAKFTALLAIDNLLIALQKHEKVANCVADILRAIITLASVEVNKPKAFTETALKLYVKVLKAHEKSVNVANWGCHIIYTAAIDDAKREYLGQQVRACEGIITAIAKHGENNRDVAAFGCKAMVGLALFEKNKDKFYTQETCSALVKVLNAFHEDATVAEWATAAMVAMLTPHHLFPMNRMRFGSAGACKAIMMTISVQHNTSETLLRLCCEVIHELCLQSPGNMSSSGSGSGESTASSKGSSAVAGAAALLGGSSAVASNVLQIGKGSGGLNHLLDSGNNQTLFYQAGCCDILMNILLQHAHNAKSLTYLMRALASLCANANEICAKFIDIGIIALLVPSIKEHLYAAAYCQWASAAIVSLCCNSGSGSSGSTVTTSYGQPITTSIANAITGTTTNSTTALKTVLKNPLIFGDKSLGLIDLLALAMFQHRTNGATSHQLVRCIRALTMNHPENQVQVTKNGMILPLCLELVKNHGKVQGSITSDGVIEHGAWILGTIEYKPVKPRNTVVVNSPLKLRANAASTNNTPTTSDALPGTGEDIDASTKSTKASLAQRLFAMDDTPSHQDDDKDGSEKTNSNPTAAVAVPPPPPAPVVVAVPPPVTTVTAAVSDEVVIMMTSRELYGNRAHWEMLYDSLVARVTSIPTARESGNHNPNTPTTGHSAPRVSSTTVNCIRWLSTVIALFADKGRLSHKPLCELLMQLVEKFVENELILSKVLFAIGALARCHDDNNVTLSGLNVLEILNDLIAGYHEGSTVIYGIFAALSGLTESIPPQEQGVVSGNNTGFVGEIKNNLLNQDHINLLTNVIPGIIKILYNDLENENIAQYACQVIASLCRQHVNNQKKFSPVCNYIADVCLTHKFPGPTSTRILTTSQLQTVLIINIEACKAISLLAHMNMLNRNRLGNSDACVAIMMAIASSTRLDDEITTSWKGYQQSLLYWCIRAIGDLAANHVNNQNKLGMNGACELLVRVLRLRKPMQGKNSILFFIFD